MVTTEKPTTKSQTSDSAKIEETQIKIQLDAPFILETPDGDISDVGQNEIEWMLSNALLPTLPDDFIWKWTTNRGSLPKRIQSYYYKEHGKKLDSVLIGEIGNQGKRHASVATTLVLDFTKELDWRDGDFGDGGSCFWGKKTGAPAMIEETGYAVRAYKPIGAYTPAEALKVSRKRRGYARAWFAKVSDNRLIVFNGYGEASITFARWLALLFNCTYKRIGLTNNGVGEGTLWINGGVGYMIRTHAAIEPLQ